jgi:hypothetical protein
MSTPVLAAARRAVAVAALHVLAAGAARGQAAAPAARAAVLPVRVARQAIPAPVPFAVGEELTYRATFGGVRAGTARMRVAGVELVRGRPAYHVVFTLDGGVPFFRVHDRYESWIDVETLASLRYRQRIAEGRFRRATTYEIYPERAKFRRDADTLQASVARPLDDGSFIYAVRAAGVRVGESRRDDRYFKPDRNPVVLTGLRRETVTVDAGTFAATVVRPTIRTKGIFSEDGEAEVWFSDDAARYPVKVRSRFSRFTLSLTLVSVTPGVEPAALPALVASAVAADPAEPPE